MIAGRTQLAELLQGMPVVGPRVERWRSARVRRDAEHHEMLRVVERIESFHAFKMLYPLPPKPNQLIGAPSYEQVPVIVCLWNRPSRIDEILDMLARQEGLGQKIRLAFWNNGAADQAHYERAIARAGASGAIGSIEIVHSPRNIHGIGRFITARRLVDEGYHGPLIMIDDDEQLPVDGVARLLAAGGERTIASAWAWQASTEDYWSRRRAEPGEWANAAAVGGAVIDSAIFGMDRLFSMLVDEGMYSDDLWLTRFALSRGWTVRATEPIVEFASHETRHNEALHRDRAAFWQILNERFPLPEDARVSVEETR